MNSKQRVQACINRQRTDAVPLGFYLADHDTLDGRQAERQELDVRKLPAK